MVDAMQAGGEQTSADASANPDLRWYIVHAYSGMEKAVERNIQERIARAGMQQKFGRILGSDRRGRGDEEWSAQDH